MQCTALGVMLEKDANNKAKFTAYVDSVRQLAVAARQAGRHQVITGLLIITQSQQLQLMGLYIA